LTFYGGLGGTPKHEQDDIVGQVVGDWITEPAFLDTLYKWNPWIDSTSMQPFISANSGPNVISFLHLIAQSIICEHVCASNSFMLIVQKGVTYEMLEEAWELPRGFLVTYAPEEDKRKEPAKEVVGDVIKRPGANKYLRPLRMKQ